jgi:hypothetical protein
VRSGVKKETQIRRPVPLTSFKIGKIEVKTDFLTSSGMYLSKAVRTRIAVSQPSFI